MLTVEESGRRVYGVLWTILLIFSTGLKSYQSKKVKTCIHILIYTHTNTHSL